MSQFSHRYLGFAALLLVGASAFAACGGLDPRKVTKDARDDGGAGEAQNPGGSGPGPDAGGSSSVGGEMGNPFGGQLFEGGAPPVLDGPPEVEMVDPADLSEDVSVDANVSLLFSEAIDPATISDASVTLSNLGDQVGGGVSLDAGNRIVVTINPTRRLSLAAKYDVNVSTAVTDSTGTALASAFASSFTTRDGEWDVTNAGFIEDPATNWYTYGEAYMTIDGRGNVLVAWPQYDAATGQQIWARWHRATTGWQDAVQVSAGPNGTGYPAIAANDAGDAVVVWNQYNAVSGLYEIMSRRYVGGAWSAAPTPVHGDLMMTNNPYSGPFVKMRGDRVIVYWTYPIQSGNLYYDYMYAQSTTLAGEWPATPTYVTSVGSSEDIDSSTLALDATGNGFLVYAVYSAGTESLYYAKYVAATNAWENAAPIPLATGVSYQMPAVAVDNAGAAMVAWRYNSGTYDLVASRYTKAKGFANPLPIEDLATEPQLSYYNSIASDGTDFFIAWAQQVGATTNAYGSRYSTADDMWSPAALLSDGDTGINSQPTLVADRQGNAMAMWLQGQPSGSDFSPVQFKFARFSAAEGAWQAPGLIAGGIRYDAYHAHASAVSDNGVVGMLTYYVGSYTSEDPAQPMIQVFR